MPSNEQRREAAKRKLERQLENRAERARRRKQLTVVGSALGVVVAVAAVITVVALTRSDDSAPATDASATTSAERAPQVAGVLPAGRNEPLPDTVTCDYPASGTASKPNDPPRTTDVPTTETNLSVSMDTTQGPIGLSLNAALAPCTVNSFASLASQQYYNGTPCHRLTTGGLAVLQCGDPTGSGSGGPGYAYANEFPTDQYAESDPALEAPVTYARGSIAMANAGPDTNGSQFFLVYGDSQLPPNYTVFGTIDEAGLATLDKIAAAGVQGGGADGPPALATTLNTVQLDL